MKTKVQFFLAFALAFAIAIGMYYILTKPSALITLGQLPSSIHESSGIEINSKKQVWTLNDSGGESEIYLCDTTGQLIRTLVITNAWNRDWEDMTQDSKGNLYISNLGNNNNKNKDLTIFKIPNPDYLEKDSVEAEIITIAYEDQKEFPPADNEMNFDCEALFWNNNQLYLSSKHRSLPMATNLYKIPDSPGHHIARKIDHFTPNKPQKGEDKINDYWITAGDISEDGSRVCLLSGNKMWVFYNFPEDQFFSGQHKVIPLGTSTQKESIVFVDNATVYITDEYWKNRNMGGKIYKVNIDLKH
ncbi:hypothetical protein [Membranihabitans marinus]|uniref:hypothetical protein n=1 Tax=Membranihabitans marinus TaxID=1227546 RepID=UPI001F180C6F|nr:hypothetical protein [Membranihabitans marinus]